MHFFTFAPLKASTGQVVEFGAFLTESSKISFPGTETDKIIKDKDLSKNIELDLIITPSDAVNRVDTKEEDYYRDIGVPHKIWLYELKKSGILELHFKILGKDGITLSEQKRCVGVSNSWNYFVKENTLALVTLILSILALIFTIVDYTIKILTYRKNRHT